MSTQQTPALDKETAFQAAHEAEHARVQAAEQAEQAAAKAPRITLWAPYEGRLAVHCDRALATDPPMTAPMLERYVTICRRAGGRFDAELQRWAVPEAQWAEVVGGLRAAGFWVPLTLFQVREVVPPWGVMGRVLWEEEQAPGTAERCMAQAWSLGARALEVRHARWTEPVGFPIPVTEIEERGDLLLSLPWGLFTLPAHRAAKGELVAVHSAAGPGLSVARTDNEAVPVALHGRVNGPDLHQGWRVQPSVIYYSDGTHSGDLGDYPMALEPYDPSNPAHAAARDALTRRQLEVQA